MKSWGNNKFGKSDVQGTVRMHQALDKLVAAAVIDLVTRLLLVEPIHDKPSKLEATRSSTPKVMLATSF